MGTAFKICLGFAAYAGAMYFISDYLWRRTLTKDNRWYLPRGMQPETFMRFSRTIWLAVLLMALLLAALATLGSCYPGTVYTGSQSVEPVRERTVALNESPGA